MADSFDSLVHTHGATVLRVCSALLGAGPDAEDAWSETFLAVFRSWERLPDELAREGWLVRIAQRKCLDIMRQHKRLPVPVEEVIEAAGTQASLEVPHDIWGAVAQLPKRQRLAIAYHYFVGLPHAQTAELIGGSAESIRRAAADGIKNLRKQSLWLDGKDEQ